MHLNLIHLDDALLEQPLFLEQCSKLGARHIELREVGLGVRLWATQEQVDDLRHELRQVVEEHTGDQPLVTWIGSGDFHHATALIASQLAQQLEKEITIVHFDNHPDWVSFGNGIHCGSWVNHVLSRGDVKRVVGLGMTSRDLAWPEFKGAGLELLAAGLLILFPLDPPTTVVFGGYGDGPAHRSHGRRLVWKLFRNEPNRDALEVVLRAIETEAVYITVDKDVLSPVDAETNWDQGKLSLNGLLAWLKLLLAHRRIVGIDVIGDYSPPAYAGPFVSRAWKRGEVFLDQPRRAPSRDAAAAVNQATNLRILAAFQEHLC